jgi:hypothetical protein
MVQSNLRINGLFLREHSAMLAFVKTLRYSQACLLAVACPFIKIKLKSPKPATAHDVGQTLGAKSQTRGIMPDQGFEARRIAREQERRVAAAAAVGLDAIAPVLQFQISALRIWANNIELLMHNCERGVESFSSSIKHQPDQQRAALIPFTFFNPSECAHAITGAGTRLLLVSSARRGERRPQA